MSESRSKLSYQAFQSCLGIYAFIFCGIILQFLKYNYCNLANLNEATNFVNRLGTYFGGRQCGDDGGDGGGVYNWTHFLRGNGLEFIITLSILVFYLVFYFADFAKKGKLDWETGFTTAGSVIFALAFVLVVLRSSVPIFRPYGGPNVSDGLAPRIFCTYIWWVALAIAFIVIAVDDFGKPIKPPKPLKPLSDETNAFILFIVSMCCLGIGAIIIPAGVMIANRGDANFGRDYGYPLGGVMGLWLVPVGCMLGTFFLYKATDEE